VEPLPEIGSDDQAGDIVVDGAESSALAELNNGDNTVPSSTLQARQMPLLR
jgi:hypothetical protein